MARLAVAVFALTAMLSLGAQEEQERVVGAGLIKPGAKFEELMGDMIALPLDQKEIDLFVKVYPSIEKWGNANAEAWKSVDDADDPLEAIAKLGVWQGAGITNREFVALLFKIKMAQEICRGKMDVGDMKKQLEFMREMAEGENTPDENKEQIRKHVAILEKMVKSLENYPEGNRKVYEANKEKLDDLMDRFEEIGKGGTEKAPDVVKPKPPDVVETAPDTAPGIGGTPLRPLTAVGRGLQGGIASFIKGMKMADAFKPWVLSENAAEGEEKLRAQLKEAGAASAGLVGFEFELVFFAGDKAVYYLRSFVRADGDDVAFLSFEGREPEGGKMHVSSAPTDAFKGNSKPFGEAAVNLLASIKSGGECPVPVVSADDLAALMPECRMRGGIVEQAREAVQSVKSAWTALKSVKADRVELRIDDIAIFVLDSRSKGLGMITGDIELKEDGNLEVNASRFRPFK